MEYECIVCGYMSDKPGKHHGKPMKKVEEMEFPEEDIEDEGGEDSGYEED